MTGITRWICVVGCLACCGCGESKGQLEAKRELKEIALAYHNFYDAHGRGPHSAEELIAYEDESERALGIHKSARGGARKALQSGNYVVSWDVELLMPPERNAGKVLAYHRDVPERGGPIAYQDGAAAVLSRAEFERAPKSQPAIEPKK